MHNLTLSNLGQTRSSQHGNHLLLTADTFVRTPLPGMKACTAVVHASPDLGAKFAQYTAEFEAGGELGSVAAQRFLYVIEGAVTLEVNEESKASSSNSRSKKSKSKSETKGRISKLVRGGYAYIPEGTSHRVAATEMSRVAVIEKSYAALDSVQRGIL